MFDGDEMNLHVPCSHDSRAEVKELMMVSKCIVSPQSNRPVMGIVQDALLACRKMTTRDVFVDKETMMNILFVIGKMDKVPTPAILKPKPLWSGKQVFSLVLPKKKYMTIHRYSGHREDDETPGFSHTDTEVYISNGELLSGILCKKTLGTSSGGIIHKAWIEDCPEEACRVISHIQFVANNWLVGHGFSVGVMDCVNSKDTQNQVDSLVNTCIRDAHKIIDDGIDRRVNASTYEHSINNTLNRARDSSGRYVQKQLDDSNNMYSMVSGGSKGSVINIAQIMACVGQQNVNGGRIGFGYTDRTLPHFQKFDNTPESRGFVKHSYMQGLTPSEFFFHAMGGREGVIDTAIKSITGDTPIIIIDDGKTKHVPIGEWIDTQLQQTPGSIKHYPNDRNMEFLELPQKVFIPTCDNAGNAKWARMTAVTRHDPGKQVYEISTRGGRKVTVAESETLLVWNGSEFSKKHSTLVKVGDCVPVTCKLEPNCSETAPQYIDMTLFFEKTRYIHGTDFNVAKRMVAEAQGDMFHIPRGWWAEHNGVEFTLPYSKKASLTRALSGRTNTPLPQDDCIYPYSARRDASRIPDRFELSMDNGRFIGLFLADGHAFVSSGTVIITKNNDEVRHFVKRWFEKYDIKHNESTRTNKFGVSTSVVGYSTLLAQFLDAFVGQGSQSKCVPEIAFTAPDVFVKGILSGYFSGDGHVETNGTISASSASEKMMNGISVLLSRIGVFGKRSTTQLKSNNFGTVKPLPAHCISIRAQWACLFANNISLIPKYKDDRLNRGVYKGHLHPNFKAQNDVVMDTIVDIRIISTASENINKLYDVTVPETLNFTTASMITLYDTSETGYIQRRLVKAMEDIKVEFDGTVRNSIGNIVQFKYGEDYMDGSMLITQTFGDESVHLPLHVPDYSKTCTTSFTEDNPRFTKLFNNVLKHFNVSGTDDEVLRRYELACVAPGEMVGIVAAQSLGQPITQMTLNTFHAAGISAVNVTLGVPRLKEIINVSKSIKSPTMRIYPLVKGLEKELMKASLAEFVTREEILFKYAPTTFEKEYVSWMGIPTLERTFEETSWCIRYEIDTHMLGHHGITMLDITYWLNNLYDTVWCSCSDENDECPTLIVRLFPNNGGRDEMDKMKHLSAKLLGDYSLKTYRSIDKCFVDTKENCIDTVGIDLASILSDPRIDGAKTTCNDVLHVYNTLGVEAARETLVREIKQVIEFDGSYVDYRHISLLVDTMTYKGSIMAITRHGINRTETGVLMRCSFEETVNIITDAAQHAEFDPVRGVTENIIMGKTAKVGTGAIDVFVDINKMMTMMMPVEKTVYPAEPIQEEPSELEPDPFIPSSPTRHGEIVEFEQSFFT